MASTNIIPFANATSNIASDATYDAFGPNGMPLGYQPPSAIYNKQGLQSTIIAAGTAQFMADNQDADVTDTLTTSQLSGYMTTAVQNCIGTQPQFDTTIKGASTAFVQRALGNAQSTYIIGADTILTPGDVGKYLLIGSGLTAPINIMLPLTSACVSGGLVVAASFADSVTFAAQGGDIINNGGVAVASYMVTSGAFITFVWQEGAWIIGGGNTNIDKLPGWRKSFVVDNGYQVFPSRDPSTGYYYAEAWASGSAIIASPLTGYSVSVSFPITFQTVLGITATPAGTPTIMTSSGDTTCGVISFNPTDASGCTLRVLRLAGNNPSNLPYLFRVAVKGLVI